MPVPGFYNGDGGHGQAAQLDGSQDAVLVLVVQGQQLVRLLHRGLERKFALDFRPVLGYTLTRRANAISHRGHVAVGLEKRICSFFIVQGKLVPAVDLVLNPFRRVLQAVQAVDDIDRLAVHIGPALQRCQQRVAVAVDVVQNDTGPVSAPKGEQRGSQVAHKVFQNAAGDVVLLLGGFAEVPDGHSQGQRIKAGLLQRRRGHSEVERIAGGHLPVVKHLELLGQRHLRGPFDREFCAAVRLGGVFVCRLLAGRFQRLLPEAGRFLQGVDAHAVGVGGGLVLRGLVALEQRLDLADEVPHGVQQLPGHAAVFLCQGLKPGRVNRQRLGEVGGDLVHGLLRGEVHACLGVAALVLLHDGGGRAVPLGQRGHGIVAVLPVCLRGHLLHPVGDLVLCHHGAGVLGVVGNMNDAVAVPSVCAALAGGLCHLDFHPGGTGQAVVEAHGLLGQAGGMFGLHEARLVAVHRGALDALPLQGQGGRRVVLTGGVGREALRLVELRGIAALHLVHVDAGDARLVVGGEACVVVVGPHAAVVAGGEGLGPVLAQAGRSVPHAADVIRLLRRRALLLHLHGGAHGLLRGRLPGFRCGGGSFPRVRGNVALRPCKSLHGVLDGLALLALGHAVLYHLTRRLLQGRHGILVSQNTVRHLSVDASVLACLLRCLGQQLIGRRGLGCRFCLRCGSGGLLLGAGFAHVVVVGGRGDNAAHHTGGRAHKEVIQGVFQRLSGTGRVSAVDAGHLPLHPVSDELLQSLTDRSGSEGQRSAQHALARVRLCEAVHSRADAPLHGVVQCAAAIGMAERQGDVEHLLRKDFLCGGGRAIEHLLLQGGVGVVLPGLLRSAAERTHGKSSHAARRSQQGVGRCVQRCLGHRSACVHQHTAYAAQPFFGPLNVLGRGLLDVVRQLIAGLGRFLLHLLVQHLRHRVILPLPVVDNVLLALDVPLVPASGLFLVFRQHGVHVQFGPLQVVGIFRKVLPVLRVASALAHGVEGAHGVAVGGQGPLGPASDGVSQAGEEAPLLRRLFRRDLRHGGQFCVFPL